MPKRSWHAIGDRRRRLYQILEHGTIGDRTGAVVARLIICLIVVNLVAVALESVPEIELRYEALFTGIEFWSLVLFTVEYVLRIWVSVDHPPYRQLRPLKARLKFITTPFGIIDLLAVLPFWFAFALPSDVRVLLVLRMIRFLKLARYSPGMRSLLDALYDERRALLGCLVILLGATLMAASVMHLVEGHIQPDKFGTIPDAMWWAIVTLGTIGYGDVVPITAAGKVVAGATIFLGLVMIALPVGIVATAFANQIHRRDFVITWSMVARVPLFAELRAGEIAHIMQLLRSQQVEIGAVIARKGDEAHSMYFIADGEVEIEIGAKQVRLGRGHFFGLWRDRGATSRTSICYGFSHNASEPASARRS